MYAEIVGADMGNRNDYKQVEVDFSKMNKLKIDIYKFNIDDLSPKTLALLIHYKSVNDYVFSEMYDTEYFKKLKYYRLSNGWVIDACENTLNDIIWNLTDEGSIIKTRDSFYNLFLSMYGLYKLEWMLNTKYYDFIHKKLEGKYNRLLVEEFIRLKTYLTYWYCIDESLKEKNSKISYVWSRLRLNYAPKHHTYVFNEINGEYKEENLEKEFLIWYETVKEEFEKSEINILRKELR